MNVAILNHEAIHQRMFKAHWKLVAGAKQIHAVIVALHDAGMYRENRDQLKATLAQLEGVRDQINDALFTAGKARSEIIRLTGCDGSCSDRD